MIKRLFTGILLALLALGAIYLYFLYAGSPEVVRNRIQTHQLYSIIFFASIVLIYVLQGGSKIFRFLIFIIVLINMYIIGDTFFRNNIGLDSRQFITLFWLIVLALATTYITHRIRFLFMAIVGVGVAFVLLTWILPMYENMPSINDFILSQKSRLINEGVTEGTLIIKNALGTKEIPVNEIKTNDIDLSQKTQLSLASKTKTGLEKLFIDLGNGSFINLNPQSAVTLEQSWDETIMQILQGNVQYYIPDNMSWIVKLIGKYKGKKIGEIQNTIRWNLVNEFDQQKEKFFISQLGGNMVLNPAIDKVIKFFINFLYSISPKAYQNNLTNYNNIQQYLGKNITWSTTKFTWENIRSFIDDIMGQVKKGAEETKINQRLNQ